MLHTLVQDSPFSSHHNEFILATDHPQGQPNIIPLLHSNCLKHELCSACMAWYDKLHLLLVLPNSLGPYQTPVD